MVSRRARGIRHSSPVANPLSCLVAPYSKPSSDLLDEAVGKRKRSREASISDSGLAQVGIGVLEVLDRGPGILRPMARGKTIVGEEATREVNLPVDASASQVERAGLRDDPLLIRGFCPLPR